MADIPRGKHIGCKNGSCNHKEGVLEKSAECPHIWLPVGLSLLPQPGRAQHRLPSAVCAGPGPHSAGRWDPGQPYQSDGRAEFSSALNEERERRELGSMAHEQEKALPGPQRM